MTEDVKVGQTVFVTKYVLSKGIQEAEITEPSKACPRARWKTPDLGWVWDWLLPRDFRLTREAAIAQARALRDAKLAELEAEAARLRALTF